MITLNTFWWQLFSFISVILGGLYFYIQHVYSYWEQKGIENFKPRYPLACSVWFLFHRTQFTEIFKSMHNAVKSGYAGIFHMMKPYLVISDSALIERILVDDFEHFQNRNKLIQSKEDPLTSLFGCTGDLWVQMREKMCSLYNPESLKVMFDSIYDTGMTLQGYLGQIADSDPNNEINLLDLSARYLTDVVAAVAFGIEVDSINDPTTYFRVMGAKSHDFGKRRRLLLKFLLSISPKLPGLLQIKLVDDDVKEFMIETVRRTLKFREKNKISRNDYMQLLFQIRNGTNFCPNHNEPWNYNFLDDSNKNLTIEECAAHVYKMFTTSFEISSGVMYFCLFELAKNQALLHAVQEDIDRALNKHDWKLTYDCIKDMLLLEKCYYETLRMYPPFPVMARNCNKDYTIPNTNVVIEKDIGIIIMVYGIHHDPKIYPNPSQFDPNRFSSEERAKRRPADFLAYGLGPRCCNGQELGFTTTAMGLAAILSKFTVTLSEETVGEAKIDPYYILAHPETRTDFRISRRVYRT